MQRRALLVAIGTTGLLAGCLGDDANPEDLDEPDRSAYEQYKTTYEAGLDARSDYEDAVEQFADIAEAHDLANEDPGFDVVFSDEWDAMTDAFAEVQSEFVTVAEGFLEVIDVAEAEAFGDPSLNAGSWASTHTQAAIEHMKLVSFEYEVARARRDAADSHEEPLPPVDLLESAIE